MTQGFNLAGTALAGLSSVLAGGADAGASAGVSGGLGGLFSGLVENSGASSQAGGVAASGGFFNALTTDASASAGAAAPDLAILLAGLQGTAGDAAADPLAALQALLQQAGVQISTTAPSDGAVPGVTQNTAPTAEGSNALQVLAAALQQAQQAAGTGDLTNPADLKTALKALGVPDEKIEGVAAGIQDMLAKLKQKLGLDDTQISQLAPLLLAANVAPFLQTAAGQPLVTADRPVTFTLKAMTAGDTGASAQNVARANEAIKFTSSLPAATSAAREVAGIEKAPENKTVDKSAANDAAAQVASSVADANLPAVAVTIDPAGAIIRDVVKTSAAATPRVSSAPAVQTVAPDGVLAAAGGDVKYTWHGEDNARPVPDTAAGAAAKASTVVNDKIGATDAAALSAKSMHADALAQAAVTANTSSAAGAGQADFAKQVEQYQQKIDLAKRYDVAGQAVVQMKNLIDNGGGQIRVKLNPPELGEIHVDLVVKDGAVSGKISASDPAVVNALAGDVKQFGDGLRQAGFKLGNEGLSFMLSQQNPQQQQPQQQQQAQTNSGTAWLADGADDEAVVAANPAAWVAPDRLLDVNI